jgi:hypothetical protein
MQEIRAAIDARLPIILLRETDDRHGAITEAELINQCPSDIRDALFNLGSRQQEQETPLAAPMVEWHRAKEFQAVVLCQLARYMLFYMEQDKYERIYQKDRRGNSRMKTVYDAVPCISIPNTAMAKPEHSPNWIKPSRLRRNSTVTPSLVVFISVHINQSDQLVSEFNKSPHIRVNKTEFKNAPVFVVYMAKGSWGNEKYQVREHLFTAG